MKVELLSTWGNDNTICDTARVSYNKKARMYTNEENEKLIRFLAKNNHWSPFAHPKVQFRLEELENQLSETIKELRKLNDSIPDGLTYENLMETLNQDTGFTKI